MASPNFLDFFENATGFSPYLWQCRLACGEPPEDANCDLTHPDPVTIHWLCSHNPCISRLIDIPTGLGKTSGVVLAWLWIYYASNPSDPLPRRLVYCLPMRTLVEQTVEEVREWLSKLENARFLSSIKPRVVVLMGGEDPGDKDWDLYPEAPAILIGTQDMLLSRALNRGYGMSRYRWPMHFALLHNDCLWVMDEVQLMGTGLASTTQLEGFRSQSALGSSNCFSWWMSATIRPDWLKTVDIPQALLAEKPLRLTEEEKSNGRIHALRTANKSIEKANCVSGAKNLREIARFIRDNRNLGNLNLVVVNTVKRARELHTELCKVLGKDGLKPLLLHSQFRPCDRQLVLHAIRGAVDGQIVISTQAIEAGVDLSAHTLFTELAPWSSLVQRFGRCNRWLLNGQQHYSDARIFWFDLAEEKDHPPYQTTALDAARERLSKLSNVAIENLELVESPDADRPEFRHVVRRKDLMDLFDTTPDLAGADIDIDRFIRDTDQSHVQVFWRIWHGHSPNGDGENSEPEKAAHRNELCSVSIGDFRKFTAKSPAYRWDPLDSKWKESKDIYPGQVYLIHADKGGYDQGSQSSLPTGWTADPKSPVQPVHSVHFRLPEAYPADQASELDSWQTIAAHTDAVCTEQDQICSALASLITSDELNALTLAARWHDWGKAHPAFQANLNAASVAAAQLDGPVAKAPSEAWIKGRLPRRPPANEFRRPHFRHELASALGVLLSNSGFPKVDLRTRDLAAYLIAAHHGKVRLSIRSMPDEWQPEDPLRFARGVWDGDSLPVVDLGGNTRTNAVQLSLEPMELGLGEAEPFLDQPSWAERCLALRHSLGPFRLAVLETILRAADARGSMHSTLPNA